MGLNRKIDKVAIAAKQKETVLKYTLIWTAFRELAANTNKIKCESGDSRAAACHRFLDEPERACGSGVVAHKQATG